MKAIKITTLITAGISVLYLMISASLSFTAFSFRNWADVLGRLFVVVFTPIMVLVLGLFILYRNERVHQVVKTVCIAAVVIVCSIYICFAMFFIALGNREERMLTRRLLVTNESFLSEAELVYYRPVAFFFKRPTKVTAADQVDYLEKKYRRPFGVLKEDGFDSILYDYDFPEVKVSVWPFGMTLNDNYTEELALASLLEVYSGVNMERGYHIVEINDRKYLCLEASGYDDIAALSEDMVCLMAGAMSGGFSRSGDAMEFFQEYTGNIYYVFGRNERGYTGHIRFGGKGQETVPADVEESVRSAYQQYGTGQDRSIRNPYADTGENGNGAGEIMPEPDQEPEIEPEPDYRETAAKAVYDAVLSKEGFSYEVCYNAKGNLYIDLGSKLSEEDNQTYSYRLVYDRPSQNGACELLVLYRSVEGSDDEAIVDMYAVEAATGKVVASGRKAWSDVGTEEYREITGE